METQVLSNDQAKLDNKWTVAQLQPFIDVYKRARRQCGATITSGQNKSAAAAAAIDEQFDMMSAHMVQQRKKVLFKRETDKKFGFLKIETSIKPESRLSKYLKQYDLVLNLSCLCNRDAKNAAIQSNG